MRFLSDFLTMFVLLSLLFGLAGLLYWLITQGHVLASFMLLITVASLVTAAWNR